MLKAKRSAAATADGNVSGVAGKGKLAAGGRNSGRIGVGDKVEGRFEAGTEWFPATVTKVRRPEDEGRGLRYVKLLSYSTHKTMLLRRPFNFFF